MPLPTLPEFHQAKTKKESNSLLEGYDPNIDYTAKTPSLPSINDAGEPERTWGETATDTAIGLTQGAIDLGGLAYTGADLISGGALERATGFGKDNLGRSQEILDDWKSDPLKAKEREVSETKGFLPTIGALIDNPQVAGQDVVRSLPSLVGGMGAGAIGAQAGKQAAIRGLEKGAGYAASKKAVQEGAMKGASTGAMAGIGIIEGGSNAQQAKNEVLNMPVERLQQISPDYNALIKEGQTPEQARDTLSNQVERLVFGMTTPVAMAAGKLTGAAGLEGMLGAGLGKFTGNMAVRGLKGGAVEATEEAIQSGGGQAIQNVGTQTYIDPSQELMEGVPEATARGMATGGLMGAPMGAISRPLPQETKRNPNDIPAVDDQGNQVGWRDQATGQQYSPIDMSQGSDLPMSDIDPIRNANQQRQVNINAEPFEENEYFDEGGSPLRQQRTPEQATGTLDKALLSAGIDAQKPSLPSLVQNTIPEVDNTLQGDVLPPLPGQEQKRPELNVNAIEGELEQENQKAQMVQAAINEGVIQPEQAQLALSNIQARQTELWQQLQQAQNLSPIGDKTQLPAKGPDFEQYSNRTAQQNRLDNKAARNTPQLPPLQQSNAVGTNQQGETIYQDDTGKRFIQGVEGAKGNNRQFEMDGFRGQRFQTTEEYQAQLNNKQPIKQTPIKVTDSQPIKVTGNQQEEKPLNNNKVTDSQPIQQTPKKVTFPDDGSQVSYQNKGKTITGIVKKVAPKGMATIEIDFNGEKRIVRKHSKFLKAGEIEQPNKISDNQQEQSGVQEQGKTDIDTAADQAALSPSNNIPEPTQPQKQDKYDKKRQADNKAQADETERKKKITDTLEGNSKVLKTADNKTAKQFVDDLFYDSEGDKLTGIFTAKGRNVYTYRASSNPNQEERRIPKSVYDYAMQLKAKLRDAANQEKTEPKPLATNESKTVNNFDKNNGSIKNGMDLISHLINASSSKGNKGYLAIANKIKPSINENIEVVVIGDGDKAPVELTNAKGLYLEDWGKGVEKIYLKNNDFGENSGLNDKTILHELLHAATNRKIREGNLKKNEGAIVSDAVERLYKLQNFLVGGINERINSGEQLSSFEQSVSFQEFLSKPEELITYSFTDKAFQEYLKGVEYTKSRSAFSEFVDIISKLFGVTSNDNAMLELIDIADQILSNDITVKSNKKQKETKSVDKPEAELKSLPENESKAVNDFIKGNRDDVPTIEEVERELKTRELKPTVTKADNRAAIEGDIIQMGDNLRKITTIPDTPTGKISTILVGRKDSSGNFKPIPFTGGTTRTTTFTRGEFMRHSGVMVSSKMGQEKAQPTGSIGKNKKGQVVLEDENGVRSYIDGGIKVNQKVSFVPGGVSTFESPQEMFDKGNYDYISEEELKIFGEKSTKKSEKKDPVTLEDVLRGKAGRDNPSEDIKAKIREKSKSRIKAENDFDKDMAAMGDFLLGLNSLKVVPDAQRETFTRLLTNLMGSSFKLGYVKFKDNAKYILDTVTNKFGAEAAENFDLQSLQGSYIAMSSGRKDATPMAEVVQTTIDDVNNADYTKIERDQNNEAEDGQVKQNLDKQEIQGNESSAGAKRDNGDNTSKRSDLERLEGEQTENVQGTESPRDTQETGIRASRNDVAGNGRAGKGRVESGGRESGSVQEQSDVGAGGRTGQPRRDLENFHIDDPKVISGGTPVVRFNKNKASINLYNQLKDENRSPTPEEQAIIASYTGWGSYGQELFQGTWNNPKPKKGWEDRDQWLRDHLGESQWKSAQNSIINAHYTDANTITAMWNAAEKMGFNGGRVLEPAMGIGNFFGMMPKEMKSRSHLTGIELDELTGGMAKMLYPKANVSIKGYQESKTPDNFYDIAISNVPFANIGIADRKYQKLNPNLHDYFFLKMVDQIRPGGLVMAITSKGTMDKIDPSIRRALAKKSEFVGAIRLPSGAFQEGAGTKVVTDIIILQKRDKPLGIVNDAWIQSAEYTNTPTPIPRGEKINVNQYFHDNPKDVLGTINYGHGTTFGRAGLIVDMPRGLQGRLDSAIDRIPEGIFKPNTLSKDIAYITNHTDDRQGSLTRSGDGFYIVSGEHLAAANDIKKYKVKSDKTNKVREDQLDQLIGLRKAYAQLIENEQAGKDADPARKELNKRYKEFTSTHGNLNGSFGLGYLKRNNDPFYTTIAALEVNTGSKENPKLVPAKILTEPTIRPPNRLKNPNINDSYVIARNKFVSPNLKDVASIANKPEAQIRKELVSSGAVFLDEGGDIIPSDIYLSGNVKVKLRTAQQAVKDGNKELQRNVDALLKVVPKDIPYHEIEAKLGASWIKPEVYENYIQYMLNEQSSNNINVTYRFGKWKADFDSSLNHKPEASTGFGTPVTKFKRLVNYALSNQLIKIYHPKDGDGVTSINQQATDEANQKIANIRDEFSEWVWSDPERRIKLEEEYNEVRNAYAEPDFDGSFLAFQGMALQFGENPFNLRKHQTNAIWRSLVKRRSLNAHEVGTGKTFTLGGIAIESRRYGIAKKPVILAHNANSAAVASEIQVMYPGAKVLYIDNLDKKNIKLRMQQIANDDWDAIVMPHSQISNLSLKEDTLMGMAAEEIEALEVEAREAAEDDGVSFNDNVFNDEKELNKLRSVTAKNLVKERNKIIESIRKQSQKSSREDAMSFEDLGIDMIMVDEAHEFKKPPIVTKMKMKGFNVASSNRSIALRFLTKYVRSMNNGGNVHLFTGTPITNTLTEIYHQQRYLMEEEMAETGVDYWDGWFGSFASEVQDIEQTSSGEFEDVTRLAAFINIPELRKMIGQYMDVVFSDDMPEMQPRKTKSGKVLSDPTLTDTERNEIENGRTEGANDRPYKKVIPLTEEMSEEQLEAFEEVKRRATRFKEMTGKEKKEAMNRGDEEVPIIYEQYAEKASFDIRLLRSAELAGQEGVAEDTPNSKASRVVANVMEIYNDNDKSAQAIFMDKYISKVGSKSVGEVGNKRRVTFPVFSVARDIEERLIKQGIPREQIAIVDLNVKGVKRKEVADKMNSGEIRVVIGSSQSLGVGVNMQKNLRAMHHLDAPWMPGELEQRNGRGHRQGNQWNTVLEYRYLTDRIDGRRWQVLAKKAKFINQFMRSKGDIRNLEGDAVSDGKDDILDTFAEAAGDPRILLKEQFKKKIKKFERKERLYSQSVSDAKGKVRGIERRIVNDTEEVAKAQLARDVAQAILKDNAGDKFNAVINGRSYDKRSKATTALKKLSDKVIGVKERMDIGTIYGYPAFLYRSAGNVVSLSINVNGRVFSGRVESIQSLDTGLRGIGRNIEKGKELIEQDKLSLKRLKETANEAFREEDQLKKAKEDLVNIEQDMRDNPNPPPVWLRNGAPSGTDIYVNGKELEVTGHRWTNDGYFIVANDSKGKEKTIFYTDAKDNQGMDLYEKVEFHAPDGVLPTVEGQGDAQAADQGTALYSKNTSINKGQTKAELDAELKRQFGTHVRNVIVLNKQSELPRHIQDADATISGAYDPSTGKIYLVAENISKEETKGLLLHEVVHSVLKSSPAYKDAIKAVKGYRYSKPYRDAKKAAEDAGTSAENMNEEVLAYLIQNHKKAPLIKRLIARIRKWLRSKFGITSLTIDDIYDIVVAMAKNDTNAEFVLNDGVVMFNSGNAKYSKANKNLRGSDFKITPPFAGDGLGDASWDKLFKEGYKPEGTKGTQITTTKGTYKKVADQFLSKDDKVLDFSGGRGAGSKLLSEEGYNIEMYEPFYQADKGLFMPKYTDINANDIPDNTYDVIINNAVLNVVPKETREEILNNIYKKLKPGGKAYISLMGLGGIKNNFKLGKTVGENEVITTKGTFQKGYTQQQFYKFADETLPGDAEMYATAFGDVSVLLKKPDNNKTKYSKETLLDPNGKPSNLNAAQWKQVRSPEFKAWFGDFENDPENASKVVDEDGNPLVVYHGTTKDFTEFREDIGRSGLGWFTADKSIATDFARGEGGNLMPIYLKIEKPIDPIIAKQKAEETGIDLFDREAWIKNKWDGYAIQQGKYISYVPFEPTQIKSATGNNGDFSQSDDRIAYSKKAKSSTSAEQDLLDPNKELNKRIREQHKSAWDKATQVLKRNFTPAGLLPKSVQELRITRDNNLGVTEIDIGELNRKLENAVKKAYGKPIHKLTEQGQKRINDALGGNIPVDMPEDIKVAVLAMRQYIDGLSTDYSEILFEEAKELQDNNQNEAAAAKAALLETIAGNIGSYINRSYKAFDDPEWHKKIPENVLNNARDYLTGQYKPEDLANNPDRVESTINTILKEGTAFDDMEAFIRESKLGAKDLSILKQRKKISPEIRALLGEYQDPRITFTKSATKMSRLIFNQRFLNKVKEVGIGSFLFTEKDRPADAYKKIASGEAYKPLDGYYTYPEIEQAFRDALGKENLPDWYRTIVQVNGMVKYGKTVLSPTTAARNWMSAFFFSMANGHFNIKHMAKSIKNARGYFKHEGNLNYLRELKQLGVVYDTPYAGEMMKLLDDSKIEDKYLAGNIKVKETMDMFTKFYQYGDDFWKIIGYENEIAMLMKYKKLTREQAKPLAAKRIRETYPTYSMTGRAIQKLRRFPLAGTFVSFPAEIIRTSFNMIKLLQQDLKDPELKGLAMRRIAGLSIASGFAYALEAAAMSMVGVTDDEEEAIRNLAAPWSKNSNIMPVGRDAKGRLRYFDLSFLDPYNYWKRPINALMRDQPVDDIAKEVGREMLTPFFGQDILFSAVDEIWNNKKETGGRIFNPADNSMQNTLDITDHLRKAVQPGVLSLMERTYKALNEEKSPSGKTYELKDEMMSAIGWRVTTFDPKVAIYYKSFEFADNLRNASNILNTEAKNPNKVSDKELLSAYQSAKKASREAFKDMINLVNAARKSGLSNIQIARLLRSNRVSKEKVKALLQGKIPDWKPNRRTFLRSSIVRANQLFDQKTKQEFIRRRKLILSHKG